MITLYYLPSPNGRKVSIALEEMGLAYEVKVVDIFRNEARTPDYLRICPNGKVPALVEDSPQGGITVFESAAILQYLGRRTGLFYPSVEAQRCQVDSWLFWQMSALGPMSGQITWFRRAARKPGRDPQETSLALHRFGKEVRRLYSVLEERLLGRDYLCDGYSIADMACWPWVNQYGDYAGDLALDYPAIQAWYERIAARPAVQRALVLGHDAVTPPPDLRLA